MGISIIWICAIGFLSDCIAGAFINPASYLGQKLVCQGKELPDLLAV